MRPDLDARREIVGIGARSEPAEDMHRASVLTPVPVPRVTPLPDGWFLAVKPGGKPSVGVVAATETDVVALFWEAMARRVQLVQAARGVGDET